MINDPNETPEQTEGHGSSACDPIVSVPASDATNESEENGEE